MSDSPSSAPLFPWIAEEGVAPLEQEIKDPVSGASITLPRLNGLTVNEVLFAQWAVEQYPFLKTGGIDSAAPQTIIHLNEFAHRFLCLRMDRADWGDGELIFRGDKLTPNDSLMMSTADGQRRAAPLYLLYLIYGFFAEEQAAWLSGKTEGGMMQTILSAIAPQQTSDTFTGSSSESTPDTRDSQAETSGGAPPTLSKAPSNRRKQAAWRD